MGLIHNALYSVGAKSFLCKTHLQLRLGFDNFWWYCKFAFLTLKNNFSRINSKASYDGLNSQKRVSHSTNQPLQSKQPLLYRALGVENPCGKKSQTGHFCGFYQTEIKTVNKSWGWAVPKMKITQKLRWCEASAFVENVVFYMVYVTFFIFTATNIIFASQMKDIWESL